ncbi:MAG: hypothetical protein WC492_04485 [Candidatus Micrarchaeia archaeon]
MKKLFFILALFSLSIVAFAQNASVEIVSPINGEYILDKDVSFKFIYHPGENDLQTANCYLKLQGKKGIGPLEVPVETEGQIDITDMPRGNFIWYMDCNGYFSSPYLLVMGNQSYEEFKQSLLDAAKNASNANATSINQTNSSVVQNQSEISAVQNQTNTTQTAPEQINQTNTTQTAPEQINQTNTTQLPAQTNQSTSNIPSYANLTTNQSVQTTPAKTIPASGTFDIAYFAIGALVVVIIGAAIYYVYKRKEKKEGAK